MGNYGRAIGLVAAFVALCLLVGPIGAPVARATSNFDLWTKSDVSFGAVEDLYRMKQVDANFCSGSTCTFVPDIANGYGGQVSWQWMTTRIPSTNPEYDYYAVYVQLTINPSANKGNPNPATYTLANYKTTSASVRLNLLSTSQRIAAYLPTTTIGSSTATYGIDASVSDSGQGWGAGVGFSASVSYEKPDVTITPNQDANWGGFQSWAFGFSSSAPSKMFTFTMTALVTTTEGADLELDLVMAWSLSGIRTVYTTVYGDSFTWTRTPRLYFPKDVTLNIAAPTGCGAVVVTWTEYKGKYFADYKVFYKLNSSSSWNPTPFVTITSSYVTGYGGGTLTKGVLYDFQLKWEVTVAGYTYGRYSRIKSSLPGTNCSGGGCVAQGTPILTPTGAVPIEDLKKGDAVVGYDVAKGELVTVALISAHRSWQESLIRINGGQLLVTAVDQPIFALHGGVAGWVRDPQDLQVGDRIFNPVSGEWVLVTSVEPVHERILVYDVVTSGPNTFIANGFLLDKKTY